MKTCFVISPIGAEGSEVREHADNVFDYIIRPAVEAAGYRPQRADHETRPGVITEQMYDRILGDDLVIAVLTYFNPNVFYEVAVAECAARPLLLLIQRDHDVPFDIKDRRIITYDLKPRPLFEGTYVEALKRAIDELSKVKGEPRVPFRPALRPLGSAAPTSRFLAREEELTLADRISLIRSAREFVWYCGLSLSGSAKRRDIGAEVRAALDRGVKVRALMMDPDNPALQHQLRSASASHVETMRHQIRMGLEFWRKLAAQHDGVSLRRLSRGVMFAKLQLSDERLIQTTYSLVRSTAETPTEIIDRTDPRYAFARAEFEMVWNEADTDRED
jgi:hypothetical protein